MGDSRTEVMAGSLAVADVTVKSSAQQLRFTALLRRFARALVVTGPIGAGVVGFSSWPAIGRYHA
jgi:hypothetical protein